MQTITTLEQANELITAGKLVGVFRVPFKLYHLIPAFQRSSVASVLRSMNHYLTDKAKPRKSSDAMLIGSLMHVLILDPSTFEESFAIHPKVDRRTTVGKAVYKEFLESIEGRDVEIANDAQVFTARAIVASILQKETACKLLDGHYEYSFFWIDEDTGVLCKCRPDIVHKTQPIVADLKKCQNADPAKFIKDVHTWNYKYQAAFYLDGVNKAIEQGGDGGLGITKFEKFVFICAEEEEPHGVSCCDLPDDFVHNGREWYKIALKRYAEYLAKPEVIKTYPDEIITLKPKGYMYV